MELEGENPTPKASASSLRWRLLREALLRRRSQKKSCGESDMNVKRVSRRATNGFNMIPFHKADHSTAADVVPSLSNENGSSDACYCYTLPVEGPKKLYLMQRVDEGASLKDFEVCNRYDIDNTGLVCQWPSEDILAYFCLMHADMFRSKRVIELGSGYGLAGLVIGATSDAIEVIISDGNPQVVDYIQRNIHLNLEATGATKMNCMALHWNQEHASSLIGTFDIIVASDCTFFKEFHKGLAQTVKLLLKKKTSSEALFFSPNRGDTLNKFLKEVKESGMHFSITENYDSEVWKRHEGFMNGDPQWPNYEKDHCYPLLNLPFSKVYIQHLADTMMRDKAYPCIQNDMIRFGGHTSITVFILRSPGNKGNRVCEKALVCRVWWPTPSCHSSCLSKVPLVFYQAKKQKRKIYFGKWVTSDLLALA